MLLDPLLIKMYALCRTRINLDFSFRDLFQWLKDKETISGEHVQRFEKEFSNYIGTQHGIAVPSARIGLYLILKALGICKDEEVIISAYNSPIVPNTIQGYGSKVVYVDADKDTFNVNVEEIEKKITKKTRAIIVTHIEGNPSDVSKVKKLTKKRGIYIIEDCAHTCGSKWNNKNVGSFGIASFFSLGLGKQINTLGGGMVCTNNKKIADSIRKDLVLLKNPKTHELIIRFVKAKVIEFLQRPIPFSILVYPFLLVLSKYDPISRLFEDEGKKGAWNVTTCKKYSDLQAQIGLKQLKNLEEYKKCINQNVELLKSSLPKLKFQKTLPHTKPFYLNLTIRVYNSEKVRRYLLKNGIDIQKTWMKNCSGSKNGFPIAQQLQYSCVYLPIYSQLKEEDLKKITGTLKKVCYDA